MKISIVDLSLNHAPRLVTESLIGSGFAVVENHPIPATELDEFYQAWDDFFLHGHPERYTTDAESLAGYFPPDLSETAKGHKARDLKEYFHFWPGGDLPEQVRDITLHYYDEIFSLGAAIMIWLQENTSGSLWTAIEKPFAEYLSRSETLLRILRYPPLTGREPPDAIRASAHEDINLITLLPAASQSGLEIQPRGADTWIPVEAPAGSIVINIGDMLQELTGGALPSTTHRVINPSGEDATRARLTAPVFCHPFPEMVLSDRYTAGSYLKERLTEINPDPLKPV